VAAPPTPTPATPDYRALTPEEARWLHDKYERLAAEEGQLTGSRTSYYAAVGTVLITGLLVAIVDLMNEAELLAIVIAFLAGLGIMISLVWAVLLHRTTDAQNMWREAARWLEDHQPPLTTTIPAPVTLRSGDTLPIDLARPYQSHAIRFSNTRGISWMDRVDPSALTEILPATFMAVWAGVLLSDGFWYFVIR
jgi:hypothetical protein